MSPGNPLHISMSSAEAAIASLPSRGRIAIGANAGEPSTLVAALAAAAPRFGELEIVQVLSLGGAALVAPEARGHLRVNALFIGPAVREAVNRGLADYTPVFLSEVPALFRSGGALPLDAALVQVSPPDAHGWCSMGVTVDVMRSAVDNAKRVIAEINPRMPRTLGASAIHISQIDQFIEVDHPLMELPKEAADPVLHRIAAGVAELIGDGDVIQAGIGAIPDGVLSRIGDRKALGFHTELISDGMMRLIESGAGDGSRKVRWPGKAVTSFVLGSTALYDWCHDNQALEMQPSDITNDPRVIAAEPNVVAINSALSIDLTGQVNADSLGHRFYSGIGGQVDFIRGAAHSPGGRPVVALPSTARGGTVSRIVGTLSPGAGVVTSRGDVHHVVTEWGRADLHGLSVRKRTLALIGLAHPRFREALTAEAKALGYLT